MFDLGWQELVLIAVTAIIVISPKDLPQAIRAVTQFARQLRGLSREFRSGVSELVREAELDDLKRQVDKTRTFDPLDDFTSASDPTSRLSEDFDHRQLAQELKRRVSLEAQSPEAHSAVDAGGRRAQATVNLEDRDGAYQEAAGQEELASEQVNSKTSV